MATTTAAEVATVRTSKRKRNRVSYLDDDHFDVLDQVDDEPAFEEQEDPVEEDLDDLSFGTKRGRGVKRRAAKKAKKTPSKKEKKQKPFRFLDLPAELRDEIYELALVEPNGLTLVSRTKNSRRSVTRGSISITNTKSYYGKTCRRIWYSQRIDGSQTSIESHLERQLIPNLLAVNQQIRFEASSFLYKQEIVLDDTSTLFQFIATIGPYNRKLINDIVVRGWGRGRGVTRGHNFSSLTALAECTNLDSLYFDCDVGRYYRREHKKLAGQIYRDGHFFLEAYATANGLDAALKVVQFSERQFAKDRYADELEFDQSKRDGFENELERLMKKGGFKVRTK
ncbi:hypothetical protein AC578_3084 [Pseudocercospora eumusae]|uniref:2EXR domain-containing protein n=1 Tax=Pseudocercospora eumusae TaxID=321146 RepID=A0A139H1L2_9PEZI|nr:hypothetical protein AC578_3084 [Pseudocercospora eumusae]